jgi:hypothetical protein
MHPWMLEQVASEHRRDLLARAARRQTGAVAAVAVRKWTLGAGRSARQVRAGSGVGPAGSSAAVDLGRSCEAASTATTVTTAPAA